MSITPVHIEKSLKNASKNYPEIYASNKKIIDSLITDIHSWFDAFSVSPFAELYGYVGVYRSIMHREQRHHHIGVRAAEWLFQKNYGELFLPVIKIEIWQHFQDDFFMLDDINKIPQMDDYLDKRFIRKIRGF